MPVFGFDAKKNSNIPDLNDNSYDDNDIDMENRCSSNENFTIKQTKELTKTKA
jgi:hypothetical protein